MATSSIFADFSIRDNVKADAFADACEWSLGHQPSKNKCRIKLLKTEKDIKMMCAKLTEKYGCHSK